MKKYNGPDKDICWRCKRSIKENNKYNIYNAAGICERPRCNECCAEKHKIENDLYYRLAPELYDHSGDIDDDYDDDY